ncbi:hypothetical protein [Hydrogenimonas sp.]
MIYGLTPVRAAQALLARISAVEVNALLQVGIEVLEKEASGEYLIRMGRHTFKSRSDTPLEPQRSYWVDIAQTKEGIIHLRNLHPKPHLMKALEHLPSGLPAPDTLADAKDPAAQFKETLLHQMAQASGKESFQSLTQLLLSLHQGVLTLPFRQDGRPALLQMRKRPRKGEDLNQKSVEFYAGMNNLGPLEGVVAEREEGLHLTLRLYYPKSVATLRQAADELTGFARIDIGLKEAPVLPLWDANATALLDIKG